MAGKIDPHKVYRETQIKTANQGKLIVMLYDEAILQVGRAIDGLNDGVNSIDTVNNALIKAQDLVTELIVSLDFERGGEIAQSLFSIYLFFNTQLKEANVKKNAGPLQNVRTMLAELRAVWSEIADKAGPPEDGGDRNGVNIAG